MPIESEDFRAALGRFASGVTVVTVAHNGVRTGLTVSAFCSVSLNPPYILICIDKQSTSNDTLTSAGAFAVNILAEDQDGLSNHFAKRIEEKFDSVAYHDGKLGMPILEDTLGHLECTVVNTVDAGDHFIYIGQVESSGVNTDRKPLLYYHSQYRSLTTE